MGLNPDSSFLGVVSGVVVLCCIVLLCLLSRLISHVYTCIYSMRPKKLPVSVPLKGRF